MQWAMDFDSNQAHADECIHAICVTKLGLVLRKQSSAVNSATTANTAGRATLLSCCAHSSVVTLWCKQETCYGDTLLTNPRLNTQPGFLALCTLTAYL